MPLRWRYFRSLRRKGDVMRTRGLAVVGLLFFTASAWADTLPYRTAESLRNNCTSLYSVGLGDCMGYIAGIVDALANGGSVAGYKACLQPIIETELVGRVRPYLFMADKEAPAAPAVARALAENFPCPD